MNLFDFSLKLNGFPIEQARTHLKEIQALNDKDFRAHLEKKKKDIVTYHLKHNSFYKELFGDKRFTDWDSVPVLTKKDLQKPLAERLSQGFTEKNVYINKTSGSSGDPFVFAKDKFCHAMTWAEIQDRFGWFGLDFNRSKQARFYGIPLDKKGYYKERFKDWLSHRYRFSVFDLSDSTLEKCLIKFQNTTFDYINGYTSSIAQLAKFLERKQVVLKSICPSLKACIVTAEMLFEDDKQLMETWFGVPIINEYGASELDLIAFQNTKNEWQVNSDSLLVEILDENNQVLPFGEEGKVVITSLYNKANPFIRYEIGDIGVLSKQSSFQKPILEKLIGRTNDMAILPSGKKAAGLTFYYITKSIIEDDGNVKEFIIEQNSITDFKIIYVSESPLSIEKEEFIRKEMEAYLEPGLKITFQNATYLERSKRGKLKQFVSNL